MTKIVLKTKITERRRTVIMTQSSTVDLRKSRSPRKKIEDSYKKLRFSRKT